jgi:hypothetical protein
MKRFRIEYWFNSCITEIYIKAENKQKALERFRELKGEKKIVSIEETE